MKIIIVSLSILLGLSGPAFAAGDAAAGKGKAAMCSACHGADGNSAVPSFPKLAGQNARYLVGQMKEIKSGDRKVVEMTGLLGATSEQDMEDIAAYFASQAISVNKAKEELVEAGQRLYRSGNKETGVAACTACHSPNGAGNAAAGFPSLGGQHADYIAKQLRAFRANDRATDSVGNGMMRDIALRLHDDEIEAVASYISGLH